MEKNFSVRYEQGKNLIEFFSVLKKRDWFWSKALLHRSGTIFFYPILFGKKKDWS
ncbi:hypothetical protein [Enterococcus raffinosus]|uniref:hypothetical protein n=1 Tax=Enterococcus raffinosus TaxID=71452 RepID=UPI00288CB375|nr:hypothetical protein [Enterococcus raffinosus]MDT2525102.1 hypothetical protein [Enterococcus raffinosus]